MIKSQVPHNLTKEYKSIYNYNYNYNNIFKTLNFVHVNSWQNIPITMVINVNQTINQPVANRGVTT